jgi:hypothetical protein
MDFVFFRNTDNFPVKGMASGPFNGDDGRLIHLVADNPADTGFTIGALQELCLLSDTLASDVPLASSGVYFALALDGFNPRNVFADFPDTHGVFQLSGSHLKAQVKQFFLQFGKFTDQFHIAKIP